MSLQEIYQKIASAQPKQDGFETLEKITSILEKLYSIGDIVDMKRKKAKIYKAVINFLESEMLHIVEGMMIPQRVAEIEDMRYEPKEDENPIEVMFRDMKNAKSLVENMPYTLVKGVDRRPDVLRHAAKMLKPYYDAGTQSEDEIVQLLVNCVRYKEEEKRGAEGLTREKAESLVVNELRG